MEPLGRYYTKEAFSKLLIDRISMANPDSVVELGVGGGALVKAAISRWLNASYYVADVDKNSLGKIKNELPFIKSFHFDTIRDDVSKHLNLLNGTVDITICNPPYFKIENEKSFHLIFEEVRLEGCKKLKQLTSDIVFLAKNLQLLKPSGELGIILPDSLLTGIEFKSLRKSIIENHNLKGIIQLPEKIFSMTEALTHILIIEKGITDANSSTPLFLADKGGRIIEETEVRKTALIDRMDYKFHNWNKGFQHRKTRRTLETVKAEVRRGSITHKKLKELELSYVHTTNLKHRKSNLCLKTVAIKGANYCMTKSGDILLSRVGTIGKVSKVLRGRSPISDCIYRIRVSKRIREQVWQALISEQGQNWIQANSHGVCAKVLSKTDLMKFPID